MSMITAILPLLLGLNTAGAVTARWDFETAYRDGNWYQGENNDAAYLAWAESYVMMGLAAQFRATGDPTQLDRMTRHLDAVLDQRDSVRGVTDYRGVSGDCWRNTSYQSAGQGYCYVVHTSMLIYPMAEFARLIREAGLEDELAEDGEPFGDRAQRYIEAAQSAVAVHDDQWDDSGYYVFREDADFLSYPGRDLPLNQSNAMGRALLVLYDVTGNSAYLDKATGLAQRFAAQLTLDSSGAYLWNYWGGSYVSPGEDISHAAINVDFAVQAAQRGVVFDDTDLLAFAQTFLNYVALDDQTISDFIGGGSVNGSSYRRQAGRWLGLSSVSPAVYTAIRNLYDQHYPPVSASASSLAGRGMLAEHELLHCDPAFYVIDWRDEDASNDESWRQATAYGANFTVVPNDEDTGCIVPLSVDIPRATLVEQWDGNAYQAVASWQASGGETSRFVVYDPLWFFNYGGAGQLYQFTDTFVDGDGIRMRESLPSTLPAIVSTPPEAGELGQAMNYSASASGDPPFWWALDEAPLGARIDPDSGLLSFNSQETGEHTFTIRLDNDSGSTTQHFVYTVTGTPSDTGGTVSSDTAEPNDSSTNETGKENSGGCGCATPAVPSVPLLLVFMAVPRRRR